MEKSYEAAISGDGRFIAFESSADNLVTGDANNRNDIFVVDLQNYPPPPPSNDHIASAVVAAVPSTFKQAVDLATTDTGMPDPIACFVPSRHSVWYRFSTPEPRTVQINTFGSSYDTVLSVFSGTPGSLTQLTCNDDSGGVQSQVSLTTTANTVYYVMVVSINSFLPSNALLQVNFSVGGNWLLNPSFTNNLARWSVSGSATHQITSGVFELFTDSAVGTTAATLRQDTGGVLPARTPMQLNVQLGNSSGERKRVQVIAQASDGSERQVCDFWLDASAPLCNYTMRFFNQTAWTQTSVLIAAINPATTGFVRVDNLKLSPFPTGSTARIDCLDPTAPNAFSGSDTANLIVNPSFNTGLPPWEFFNSTANQVTGGVAEFYFPTSDSSAPSLRQTTTYAPPDDAPLQVQLQLGNSSSIMKEVRVILRAANSSDVRMCYFNLLPNAPLRTFTMQTHATMAFADLTLMVQDGRKSSSGWVQVDGVVLKHRPTLDVNGTHCLYPAGENYPMPELDLLDGIDEGDGALAAPTLVPTATALAPAAPPVEPTLNPTATPFTDPTGGEGAGEGTGG